MPTKPLTPTQKETLEYIRASIKTNGYAPSVREVARRFKIGTTTAHDRIRRLVANKYLRGQAKTARGLRMAQ